jgi:FkbM family methyltransferase
MEGALLCLKARGFDPRFAIDIGAYVGEWTVLFKTLFPECRVLMVEAQDDKADHLRDVCDRFGDKVEYRLALLGATSGTTVNFVQMETGSSVFEERSDYPRTTTTKTLITLDHLLGSDARRVDFLKLDVQGYELEILRGASRALAEAQGVLMEVSLVPSNKGAPLIAEVLQFMADRDFRMVDFCSQIRRNDGVLWQTDLLFVSVNSSLLPTPDLAKTVALSRYLKSDRLPPGPAPGE